MVARNFKAVPGVDNESLLVTQSGAGAVERTVQDKLRDVVSVKDFGASPDASSSDNTAAFVAAMEAVSDGSVVLVPSGTYNLQPFYIRPGVLLTGESKKSTVLKVVSSSGNYGIGLTSPYSRLENLTIDGSNAQGYGLLIDGPKTVSLQHVLITSFSGNTVSIDGTGVVLQSTWSHSIRDCEISNNKRNIFLLDDGGEINQIIFDNCTIEYSSEEGVLIDKGTGITFINCSFGHHGTSPSYVGTAIKVTDTENTLLILNTWFEFCAIGVDFLGAQFVGRLLHSPCRHVFKAGQAQISNSDFYGYGGYIEAPAGSTASVIYDQCVHRNGYTLLVDTANVIRKATSSKASGFNGTLTPSTSGSISVFTSEDLFREISDGLNVTVTGRLSVSGLSSPVGPYVNLGGLTYTCANLSENSDYAVGSCVFYDADLTSFSVLPAYIFGGSNVVRIVKDASTVGLSDFFALTITYPIA